MAVSVETFERVKTLCQIDKQLTKLQDEVWQVIESCTTGLTDRETMNLMDSVVKGGKENGV